MQKPQYMAVEPITFPPSETQPETARLDTWMPMFLLTQVLRTRLIPLGCPKCLMLRFPPEWTRRAKKFLRDSVQPCNNPSIESIEAPEQGTCLALDGSEPDAKGTIREDRDAG